MGRQVYIEENLEIHYLGAIWIQRSIFTKRFIFKQKHSQNVVCAENIYLILILEYRT